MTRHIDIAGVIGDFPDFRVAAIVAEDLAIPAGRPQALETEIARREAEARARWAGMELAEIPGVAAWRRAYRAFGVKRTSYRSSVERLVKNVLAGRELPRINAFVDAYNAVSLHHVLPAGADDLDHVAGDVAFRRARPGDDFLDMAGEGETASDSPKEGEVVYADAAKVLCRRWNWRQGARSLVTPETRRAVLTVQSNGVGDVAAAAEELAGLLVRHCAARCTVSIADADRPVVALPGPG